MFEEENNSIVNISIKEIVEELSNYTGINVENIGIDIEIYAGYWGTYTFQELADMINSGYRQGQYYVAYDRNKDFKVILSADKKKYYYSDEQKFCYDLKIDLNLNEIQADGKTLLEHCRSQLYYDDQRESHYTGLVIDKDVENLNYKVNLNDIDNCSDPRKFYPKELFKQVILNIIEKRNKEKSKAKTLK